MWGRPREKGEADAAARGCLHELSYARVMSLWLAPGPEQVPRFLCFGSSGACVQIGFEAMHRAGGTAELVAYVDDQASGTANPFDARPVISFDQLDEYPGVPVLVPVQNPRGRRSVYERLEAAGRSIVGMPAVPYLTHPSVDVAEGAIFSITSRVGPGSVIGRAVMVMSDLVSEDVTVGAFTTLAMHSIILGHVRIGEDVLVAPGAIVGNGKEGKPLTIGDGAVIGTGAVVDRNVEAGEVIMGNRGMTPIEWARLRRTARPR